MRYSSEEWFKTTEEMNAIWPMSFNLSTTVEIGWIKVEYYSIDSKPFDAGLSDSRRVCGTQMPT